MWILDKIELIGVGTHKHLVLEIPRNKTLSIIGINHEDEGQESNGSGKSFLGEGISLGIIGTTLKKARYVDIINDDMDEMEINIFASNSFLKKEMEINRVFPRRGSSRLVVKINGVDQVDKFEEGGGDKFILDQIGISKEDLLGYFIISKTRYRSFFSSSDTIKKEIISRFSGADLLNGVDDLIDKKVTALEGEKRKLEDEKISIETKITTYQEELEEEKKRNIEEERQKRIDAIQLNITSFENNILKLEKEILEIKEKKGKTEGEINELNIKLKAIDIKKIEKEIDILKTAIIELEGDQEKNKTKKSDSEKEKNEFDEFLAEINTLLAGVIECPNCKFEFNPAEEEASIPAYKDSKKQTEEEIKKIEKKIEEFLEKDKELNKKVVAEKLKKTNKSSELSELERAEREINSDITKKQGEFNRADEDIKSKENLITNDRTSIIEKKKLIEAIKIEKIETRVEELNTKISQNDEELEELIDEITEKETEIFKESQWNHNFKRFNSHLAVKALKVIEGRINLALRDFGSDLLVELSGFKVLANNTIREKISTHVRREDGREGALIKFSQGENGRIEMASVVALQSIINQSTSTGGFNFLIIDEILESLDPLGVQLVLEGLNKLDETTMVITHVGTDSINFENILLVEKEGGESKVSINYLN